MQHDILITCTDNSCLFSMSRNMRSSTEMVQLAVVSDVQNYAQYHENIIY